MESKQNIVELDVRPYLRKKVEPFQIIMDTVKKLSKEDTFVLHATFKPTPLLGVMKTKGFVSRTEKLDSDHWVVTFVHKSRKQDFEEDVPSPAANRRSSRGDSEPKVFELDNRGLEPPQPMIRTLSKLEASAPGDKVIIHNDRVPVFLIEELNTLGYPYSVEEQPDGSARVTISKV
jgi:uncharacterized protein (DUF2249 family)